MRKVDTGMKRYGWWVLAGLLALGLLVWAFMPQPVEVELASVTRGPFERAVQEEGKTRLRERYVVSAPLAGRLERITLQQGDAVQRGALLATLWPTPPALLDARDRAQRAARIGALQAALSGAQATALRAQAALEQARADLARSESLARTGFVSDNQNEGTRLAVRLRTQELEAARQAEEAARHELEVGRSALLSYAEGSGTALQPAWPIRSPVDGRVLKVLQQSEAMVPGGAPLLELGDPGRLEVVADILTEDAAQIAPGAAVRLSGWGGAEVLQGRVRLVEPAAFTKVSALGVEEQRVHVVIDLAGEPIAALGDGFRVDVRILVQQAQDVLQVPVSALFPQGTGWALFVVEGGRAQQRAVTLAVRNGSQAWLQDGPPPGTPVVVYPPSALRSGERVQAR